MGKMKMGILGDFRNKIGTVVGQRWRAGQYTTRAYVKDVRNPNTAKQQLQRAKFSVLGKLGSEFQVACDLGFRPLLSSKPTTAVAEFVSRNSAAVHANTVDSVTIDYADLIVAAGGLVNVRFGTPQFDTPQQVDVSFADNMGSGIHTSLDDLVYLFIYCPDAKCGILSDGVQRREHLITVDVPAYWNGMKVHVYGFTVSADNNKKYLGRVSDSMYIGTGNIG